MVVDTLAARFNRWQTLTIASFWISLIFLMAGINMQHAWRVGQLAWELTHDAFLVALVRCRVRSADIDILDCSEVRSPTAGIAGRIIQYSHSCTVSLVAGIVRRDFDSYGSS